LEKPKSATRDVTEKDLYWNASFLESFDPVKPLWLDD
jgi:hypothetical protein